MNFKKNKNFIIFYLFPLGILIGLGIIRFAILGRLKSFLVINHFNFQFLDYPLLVLTYFGESIILIPLIILLFWKRKPELTLLIILSLIITGIITQILKEVIFVDWKRPLEIFTKDLVHTVGSYTVSKSSFPSGHSINIASASIIIAYELQDKLKWKLMLLFAFMAVISYSRIYTGMHFLGDVLAGCVIGTSISLFSLKILHRIVPAIFKLISPRYLKVISIIIYPLCFILIIYAITVCRNCF